MASQMEEKLQCPICLEVFKKPIRILSCGHNLCQGCLKSLLESSLPKRCPSCRSEINSTLSIETFQRNFIVENIVEEGKVIQKEKVLFGDEVEQLKVLARAYEQDVQLNEAVGTWRTIVSLAKDSDKILPLVSMIECLLKIGELDEAVISSVELISMLESTADRIQPIINECDHGICNIIEKFLQFEKLDVIFQLLHGHFCVLKRHCGEVMLSRMSNISVVMTNVVKVVISTNEIELFRQQYEFFDNVLLHMQNLPVSDVTVINIKCREVAVFSSNYGSCCKEVKDYIKAALLHNQAIALRKLAFGDESNDHKNYAFSYHDLGCALENSNHHSAAKNAFQTAIKLKKQVRDFENEEKRNESILVTSTILKTVENKLQYI